MRKYIIPSVVALALAISCSKVASTGINDENKRVFDAWRELHYPDAKKTALGAYIIEDEPGTGPKMSDSQTYPYIRFTYTIYDLKGNVQKTTSEKLAQQVGTYSDEGYFGPQILYRGAFGDGVYAGLDEAFRTMNVGGRRKLVLPGWLCSYGDILKDADYYLRNGSGTSSIYELRALEQISDIERWEIDSLYRYVRNVYPAMSPDDTLKNGLYYHCEVSPKEDAPAFDRDTVIYINYVGRLLDGKVFDTSVRDTAIKYGIFSPSGSYGPKEVKMKDTYSESTMGDSNLIEGFSFTLSKMHPFEKGVSMFYSGLAYGASGSGSSIPGYCPLRFDIEVVAKP